MILKNLFTSVNNISSREARTFIDENPAESFTLLDVRTPGEYERAHLPGAKLIPISELADRLADLDRDKPILTY